MELKVWVDGIQRVVCGVSEQTTCQEVVIALAQAIGEFPEARMGPAGVPAVGPGLWAPSGPQEGGAVSGPSCLSPAAQARWTEGKGRGLTDPSPRLQARQAALCLCSASERRNGSCYPRNALWAPKQPADSLPVMSSLS